MVANIRHITYLLILLTIDLIGFYLSLGLAFGTRLLLSGLFQSLPTFITSIEFFLLQLWIPFVLILTFAYEGLYSRRGSFWIETKSIVKSVMLTSIIVLSIITLTKMTDEVSRLFVVLLFFYCLFVIPICRLNLKRILHKRSIGTEGLIIIGDDKRAMEIAALFEKDSYMGFRVRCLIGQERRRVLLRGRGVEVYKGVRWLKKLAKVLKVSTVVLVLSQADERGIIAEIQRMVKKVFIAPDIAGIGLMNTELIPLFQVDIPLLYVKNNLKEPINVAIKQIFDFTLAFIILPFLIPLFIVIAIAIKLDSRGTVLFSQNRVGKGGKEFKVFKFRTMYTNSEEILDRYLKNNPDTLEEFNTYCKLKDDPRVTRLGRFLRKTSLDELPQIINILKGEMSFVGPRPAFRHELERYYGELAYSYEEVKPGITGLWQVSGRNQLTMKDRAKLESFYVTNWSLWLDIVILFKTIKVVVKKEGAY